MCASLHSGLHPNTRRTSSRLLDQSTVGEITSIPLLYEERPAPTLNTLLFVFSRLLFVCLSVRPPISRPIATAWVTCAVSGGRVCEEDNIGNTNLSSSVVYV